MIVHMCKLRIVVLDEDFDHLLEGLQELGCLHLEEVTADIGGFRVSDALHRMLLSEEEEKRRGLLVETRRYLSELASSLGRLPDADPADLDQFRARPIEEVHDLALELLRKARSIRRRRANLLKDRKALERYLETGRRVRELNLFGDEADVGLFVYPADERAVARELQKRLSALSIPALKVRTFRGEAGKMVAAVVCPVHRLTEVKHTAWEAGALEFKLPHAYRAPRLAETFERIQRDMDQVPDQVQHLDMELERLTRQAGHTLSVLDRICAEELQKLEVRHRFVEGSCIRVLQAWAPIDQREEVERQTALRTRQRFLLEELPLGPHPEDVPVILRNPRFAQPFEVLLKIFPPPTYGSIDPTMINAIGVPFFFGMIVGDAAYGLVILALSVGLRLRFRHHEVLRSVGAIGSYCAVSTILFGLIYGEALGDLGARLGLQPLLHREDPQALILLLKIALGIGAVHMVVGLALGVLNARVMVERHALLERGGQLLCLLGIVLAVTGWWLNEGWMYALAGGGFAAGVGTLLWGTGVVGLLEVFSLISNILSYARLMALGVASVVLALVANRLFDRLDFGLIGLVIATLLHGLNIVIGMFSPTIHTLRLHYVEFFSKFYQPGGRDYVRFGTGAQTNHEAGG